MNFRFRNSAGPGGGKNFAKIFRDNGTKGGFFVEKTP